MVRNFFEPTRLKFLGEGKSSPKVVRFYIIGEMGASGGGGSLKSCLKTRRRTSTPSLLHYASREMGAHTDPEPKTTHNAKYNKSFHSHVANGYQFRSLVGLTDIPANFKGLKCENLADTNDIT